MWYYLYVIMTERRVGALDPCAGDCPVFWVPAHPWNTISFSFLVTGTLQASTPGVNADEITHQQLLKVKA